MLSLINCAQVHRNDSYLIIDNFVIQAIIRCFILAVATGTLCAPLLAQQFILSGYIEDGSTGERLPYAALYNTHHGKGVSANPYGFFSLPLPEGTYQFVISHVGYSRSTLDIVLHKDTTLVVELDARADTLQEIEVTETRERTLSSMNLEVLTPEQAEDIPLVMGEPDMLKALQVLPGVRSGADGSAGLYIRGGGPDQNMILFL